MSRNTARCSGNVGTVVRARRASCRRTKTARSSTMFQFFPFGLPLALVATSIVPTTWYVGPNPNPPGTGTSSDPFTTIQAAVDAAHTNDTVLIEGGATYFEHVFLDSKVGITLRANPLLLPNGDVNYATIDGEYQGACLQLIGGGNCVFEGLRVTHGQSAT